MNFNLSLFDNKLDTLPRPAAWSWEDFCVRLATPKIRANKDGALFAPATFEPARRKKENVTELSLLVLDYDHHANLTRDTAVWRKLDLRFAVYTTHSHQRVTEEHAAAEDRFRVMIPLAEPIPAAQFPALWRWAAEQSGGKIDPAPKDVSRMFFLPAKAAPDAPYTYEVHDGDLLDWRTLPLEVEPVITPSTPITKAVNANGTRYAQAALSSAAQRVAMAANGTRNATLNAEAFSLGQLVGAGVLSESDVVGALESAAQSAGLDGREIQATIRSGIQAGVKEPRHLPEPATKRITQGSTKETRKVQAAQSSETEGAGELPDGYQEHNGALVLVKGNGTERMPLTNFFACILSDVIRDDGTETSRVFEIEATLNGQATRADVTAEKFSTMNWPVEMLGAKAIIYPNRKDHARTAIQTISDDIKTRRVYAHTGWREIDGAWCYLHGGGAIGANGQVAVDVKLSATLAPFKLPAPPQGDELLAAIRAEISLLDVAPDAITVPALGCVWAAIVGDADFSLFLEGRTGWGKTQLAIVQQQHFGKDFEEKTLPGNWMTTANANAEMAYEMKDAVMVVDDFKPTGTAQDVARFHKDADRLLRGQGNRAGRGRLRADSSRRESRPPRGLIVSTGEDVPKGESLRARLLILRYEETTTDWPRLTQCQHETRQGLYAQGTAAFIQWLAPRYAEMRRTFVDSISAQREIWTAHLPGHKRTPTTAAYLSFAWQQWLTMAASHGAITKDEFEALWRRIRKAIKDACLAQASYQVSEDPARRFVEVIQGALLAGKCHVATIDGLRPDNYESWGWRGGDAQGERIGWLEDKTLYLNPDVTHSVATKIGGADVTLTATTLWKRLRQAGYLIVEKEQDSNLVRKTIDGRRARVLAIPTTKMEAEDNADRSL